jgi:ribonuclease HI
MSRFALFTDVSVNPQRKVGVGGYLLVPGSFLESEPHDIEQGELSARIKIKMFSETSSTKLEVQTVLWALDDLRKEFTSSIPGTLQIYTDSQCVAGLVRRRDGLIRSDFIAKRSGQPLTNALLYREFYAAHDRLGFKLIKVPGHSPACTHDAVQRIFSCVDREVRRALTLWRDVPTHPRSGLDPSTS